MEDAALDPVENVEEKRDNSTDNRGRWRFTNMRGGTIESIVAIESNDQYSYCHYYEC